MIDQVAVWKEIEELLPAYKKFPMPWLYRRIIESCQEVIAVPGELAEVGVFIGVASRCIAKVLPGRNLHLFDTFDGMPAQWAPVDGTYFTSNTFKLGDKTLSECQRVMNGFANVHYHVGTFPQTITPDLSAKRFAFVHLDCDLYKSITDGLEWFWPRMSPGGIIQVHDLWGTNCPGAFPAVRDFTYRHRVPFEAYPWEVIGIFRKP